MGQLWRAALRSSELYVGIASVVIDYLVGHGLLDQQMAFYAKAGITYVVSRIISKTVKAAIPPSGPVALKPVPILVALVALCMAAPVSAQTAPPAPADKSLFDGQRFDVAATAGAEWNAGDVAPSLENTAFVGGIVSYGLASHLAVALPGSYGFRNKLGRIQPQARWRFDAGRESLSLTLGYGVHIGPGASSQWRTGVALGRQLWRDLYLGLTGDVGISDQSFESRVMVSVPVFKGKDS
jgi:hypothetical protein